jgi:uncharacterized protein with HEPN domain
MTRDIQVYIDDILDSIAKIERYTKAINEQDFLTDTQVQDAVLRRLEIMGEAVKNIPRTIRDKYPQLPWKNIAGLRDVLIHEYFGVNMRRVWKVARQDINDIRQKLLQVQKDLNSTG